MRADCRRDRDFAQRRHRKNPSSASVAGDAANGASEDAAAAARGIDAASHTRGRVRANSRRGGNNRERRTLLTGRACRGQVPLADRRSGRKRFLLLRQSSRRRPVLLRRTRASRLSAGCPVTNHRLCGRSQFAPRVSLRAVAHECEFDDFLVLPVRIELTTSPLPRGCSTTELRQRGLAPNIGAKARRCLP